MAFIGFVRRLNSTLFEQIIPKDGAFLLNGKEVHHYELCGVPVCITSTTVTICDLSGTVTIAKSAEMEINGKGPYLFTVKPYLRKGAVAGYCKSIRQVSIYEEIAFNLEVKSLVSTCCY